MNSPDVKHSEHHPSYLQGLKLACVLTTLAIAVPYQGSIPGIGTINSPILYFAMPLISLFLIWHMTNFRVRVQAPVSLVLFAAVPVTLCGLSIWWTEDSGETFSTLLKHLFASLAAVNAWLIFSQLPSKYSYKALVGILLLILAGSIAMYAGVPAFEFSSIAQDNLDESQQAMMLSTLYTRLGHPFIGRSNDLAPVLALIFFALFGYAEAKQKTRYYLFATLAFVLMITTLSRAQIALTILAWLGYELLVLRSVVRITRIFIAAVATALVLLAIPAFQELVGTVEVVQAMESRFSNRNIVGRFHFIEIALMEIEQRFFLGYGGGVSGNPAALPHGSHNTILQLFLYYGALMGSIGAIALFAPLFTFYAFLNQPDLSTRACDFLKLVYLGWLSMIGTALSQTYFEAAVPRIIIYFLAGILCAMAFQISNDNKRVISLKSDLSR